MPLQGNPLEWSSDTQQGVIRDALLSIGHRHTGTRCTACLSVYETLKPQLGTGHLRFWRNPTGDERLQGITARIELPAGRDRGRRCLNKIREVHDYVSNYGTPVPEPQDVGCGGCDNGDCCGACACCPQPEPEPRSSNVEAAERFYAQVQRARAFTRSRGIDPLESMRIIIDGAHALKRGVPVEALMASITVAWQDDSRAQFLRYVPEPQHLKPVQKGDYDYASFAPRPSEFAHAVSGYVLAMVQANVPVWLHGPAGTGKSSAAKYAAQALELDYFEVNLAGAMVSAIKGKDRLNAFVQSEFAKAYGDGGVICLEEFDAAHPTVATAINNAIAGDVFHNDADLDPETGTARAIKRSPNFRIVATANTLGNGADKTFGSRQKLDGATIDRFRMGRVYVGLDLELERRIFETIVGA